MHPLKKNLRKKIECFCNRCKRTNQHSVKSMYLQDDVYDLEEDIGSHLIGTYVYQTIECDGCKVVAFRRLDYIYNFDDFDSDGKLVTKKVQIFEYFYPERGSNFLSNRNIMGLPVSLSRAYKETIEAYNYELRLMCSAGLRSIVEGICNCLKIDDKLRLPQRIKKLSETKILSQTTSESLLHHRFLGNDALHQLEIPEGQELRTAIEIIEHALVEIFEIPEKDKFLRKIITDRIAK